MKNKPNKPTREKCRGLKGRVFFKDTYPGGKRVTMYLARELVEMHIGRFLVHGECVHHCNGDQSDDRIENLEIKSRGEHTRGHRPSPEKIAIVCPECGRTAVLLARQVRHSRSQGKAGPFCGKRCAGKYGARLTPKTRKRGERRKRPWLHGTQSGYRYRKCRCKECCDSHTEAERNRRARRRAEIMVDRPV